MLFLELQFGPRLEGLAHIGKRYFQIVHERCTYVHVMSLFMLKFGIKPNHSTSCQLALISFGTFVVDGTSAFFIPAGHLGLLQTHSAIAPTKRGDDYFILVTLICIARTTWEIGISPVRILLRRTAGGRLCDKKHDSDSLGWRHRPCRRRLAIVSPLIRRMLFKALRDTHRERKRERGGGDSEHRHAVSDVRHR